MRFHSLIIGLTLWITSTTAQAFTVDALRAAVTQRDFAAVETGLTEAQDDFLQGTRAADDMRKLYIALSRSAPEMVQFVEDWLARDPRNPKAQIARAWSLYNAANFVRRPNNGYSVQVAEQMYQELRSLVSDAFLSAPNLIPVADAMVRKLGLRNLETPHPGVVLDATLTQFPNYGTIQRYIPSLGSYPATVIKEFCESVAVDFDAQEAPIIEQKCLLETASYYGLKGLKEHADATLWTNDHPLLDLERLEYFVNHTDHREWTDDQIEWAIDILLTKEMDQFQTAFYRHSAKRLDQILRSSFGRWRLVEHDYKRTRYDQVKEFLKHDPYNLNLIDLAEGVEFRIPRVIVTLEDGRVGERGAENNLTEAEDDARRAADDAEGLEFALRRLRASPYDSNYWSDYSGHLSRANRPQSMFDGDAADQNAIVFSNDPAQALLLIVGSKTGNFKYYTEWSEMSAEQLTHMPGWQETFSKVNLAEDILCPFLRAKILHEAVCEHYQPGAQACLPAHAMWKETEDALYAKARKAPECAGLLAAEPAELWYTPVDFDEATRTGTKD